MLQNKVILIVIIAVAASLAGGIATFAIGLPGLTCAGVAGTTRTFTVVADLKGYNDSVDHQFPWPVISANRCDTVVIKVVNDDTQTHGFAIDYYATRGTEIQGQQSVSFQFLATKTGQFRMYCIVPCTVHFPWMQHGQLNVT
jgi:FtsP/CotA-like multicopper oxidase with cupredoxin domain